MTIYVYLVLLGLIIKLWLSYNVLIKHDLKDPSLTAQTTVAAIIFITYSVPQFLLLAPTEFGEAIGLQRYQVLRVYFYHGTLCLISGLYSALTLLDYRFHKTIMFKSLIVVYAVVGAYFQLFTDWLVEPGVGRSPFAVELGEGPGIAAIVATRVAVITLVAAAMLRFYQRYQLAKSHDIQIASMFAMSFCFLFLINSILALIVVHPVFFATRGLFFFIAMMLIARDKPVFDARVLAPATREHKVTRDLVRIFNRYANDKLGHRDAMRAVERLFVSYKMGKVSSFRSETGSSLPDVADSMQMSLSTLYDTIRRLELERPDKSYSR